MKIEMHFLVLLACLSCNVDNKDKCADAVIDEKIEALSEYRRQFYDKKYTGTVRSYFEGSDDQIAKLVHYKSGDIVKYESFYENGDPKIIKPIKCNSTHGTLVYFMDKGKVGYELEYVLGKMHGKGNSYYENGRVQKTVQYENDKKNGAQYEFSEQGDTILIEIFDHGKKIK